MDPARILRLSLSLSILALAGCEATPTPAAVKADAPEPADAAPQAARPDAARLRFDAPRRLLTLYPLPDPGGRWMLALPGPGTVPVNAEYEFPASEEFDWRQVCVFYTVPNQRPSPPVSVQDILDARQ